METDMGNICASIGMQLVVSLFSSYSSFRRNDTLSCVFDIGFFILFFVRML